MNKFWDIINDLACKDKEHNIINLRNKNTGEAINKEDTSSFINEYFSTIGSNLAQLFNTPWSYDGDFQENTMTSLTADPAEVLKLCREIKPFKSSSIHQLSSKVLKDAFLVISTQLTHLFNLIFTTGVYPDIWKRANVIPLFKGGDLTNVNNYRPISLLSLPGKIIEKIIHSQINNFLDDNHLLNSKQDGFRKGRSTIDTIAGFTDDIYSEMDIGNCSVAVFIDFRKAFDVVNHNILVKKLSYMGIQGNNLNLLTNYLRNRSQCTLANSVTSQPCSMTYGVPQGSTLGPLQFLIYINDLYKSTTTSKMHLYADDFFFSFFYLARHKISITLVYIECLDHMQSTSQLLKKYTIHKSE